MRKVKVRALLTGLFEPLCVPVHCKSFIPAVPGADSNGGGLRVLAKFANDPLQQVHVKTVPSRVNCHLCFHSCSLLVHGSFDQASMAGRLLRQHR